MLQERNDAVYAIWKHRQSLVDRKTIWKMAFWKTLDDQMKRNRHKISVVLCPKRSSCKKTYPTWSCNFPPNTTSKTQPMDQKRDLLRQLWAIDSNNEFTISLLDATRLLQLAWQSVTPAAMQNWYRHAGFVVCESASSNSAVDDIEELDYIPLAGKGTSSSVLQH